MGRKGRREGKQKPTKTKPNEKTLKKKKNPQKFSWVEGPEGQEILSLKCSKGSSSRTLSTHRSPGLRTPIYNLYQC